MRAIVIAIWVLMVASTGYALFNITYQVEALEGELAELNAEIRAEREKIHNLKAEWAYSSRVQRIEMLGEEHLPQLERMMPAQAFDIEDIPFRRPDALSDGSMDNPAAIIGSGFLDAPEGAPAPPIVRTSQ